jgi:hypothetical protein
VKRFVGGWLVFAAFATIALLLARVLEPGRLELELDVFVLAVGGLALLEIVIVARESYPREERSAIAVALEREAETTARPPELERLERELTLARASAFDLHTRLRPVLVEIARGRPEEELGEELWELVRPDRQPPTQRHAPGIEPEALRRIVERLEAL